jgi:diketogulonate reductase-like aldo/keto reductase
MSTRDIPSESKSKLLKLKSGIEMPSPGFGTWRMGEIPAEAGEEIVALRRAFERGFALFDTAEMYGDGGSEELLGEALAQIARDEIFVTSKFYPWHAAADQVVDACERSLSRLGMDHIDLYVLHWPGSTPFQETLEGARRLLDSGKIRAFGVSNFDVHAMAELVRADLDQLIDANQVLYNPARRGIEFDLLPKLGDSGIACIAYTPLEPSRLSDNNGFGQIAAELGLSPAQLAMAWHMTRGCAVPIPKAAKAAHVDALADAVALDLTQEALDAIDKAFPPPEKAQPLDII